MDYFDQYLNRKNSLRLTSLVQHDQRTGDLELPSWCLDSLTYSRMFEPVELPSKQIVDLLTIAQHLQENQCDPFTRQPMRLEDAVPKPLLGWRVMHQVAIADFVRLSIEAGVKSAQARQQAQAIE